MLIVYRFDIESNSDNENNMNILQQSHVFDDDEKVVIDENDHQRQLNTGHFLMSIFRIESSGLVKENNQKMKSIRPTKVDCTEHNLPMEN